MCVLGETWLKYRLLKPRNKGFITEPSSGLNTGEDLLNMITFEFFSPETLHIIMLQRISKLVKSNTMNG